MAYEVKKTDVEPRPIAAVWQDVPMKDLPAQVPALLGEVWDFFRRNGITRTGHNVIIYNDAPETIFGVEVFVPLQADERVRATFTPMGPAATTTHFGPYSGLSQAHEAIQSWCTANHEEIAGPNWEIYGDWEEDPAKLRTEVFYLLKDPSARPPKTL